MSTPRLLAASMLLALTCASSLRAEQPLVLNHCIIYVGPGAPQRPALEKVGFTIAPQVNHHSGQGTSSITVEFINGYLELLYPDSTVPVSANLESVAQRFRDRADWQRTGMAPFGLQFRRTRATPESFPFPTFKVHSDWMAAGESLEILTPREIVAPAADRFPPAGHYVEQAGAAKLTVGKAWLMILTLDGGQQHREADLSPELPLIVRY